MCYSTDHLQANIHFYYLRSRCYGCDHVQTKSLITEDTCVTVLTTCKQINTFITYLFNLTILIQTSKPCNKIICITYLFNLTILIQTSKPCNKIICITHLFNLTILIHTSKLCNKIICISSCAIRTGTF